MGGRIYPVNNPAAAPTKYGQASAAPKVHTIDLSTARTNEKFGLGGSFIWAYKASSKDAAAEIRFNNERSDAIEFKEGMIFAGFSFGEAYVTNTAQAGAYISFVCLHEDREIRALNPAVHLAEVDISKSTTFTSVADTAIVAAAAAVSILAASATRREVIIRNLTASAGDARIGDASTAAAQGLELSPGESLVLTTTAAVYAYSAAGCTLSICHVDD